MRCYKYQIAREASKIKPGQPSMKSVTAAGKSLRHTGSVAERGDGIYRGAPGMYYSRREGGRGNSRIGEGEEIKPKPASSAHRSASSRKIRAKTNRRAQQKQKKIINKLVANSA